MENAVEKNDAAANKRSEFYNDLKLQIKPRVKEKCRKHYC